MNVERDSVSVKGCFGELTSKRGRGSMPVSAKTASAEVFRRSGRRGINAHVEQDRHAPTAAQCRRRGRRRSRLRRGREAREACCLVLYPRGVWCRKIDRSMDRSEEGKHA